MTTRLAEKSSATALDVKIEQMLTEARVILPGAQALFGFQLAIVFTRSFADLPAVSVIVHAASLLLVTLTVVLLMAPAAYHRLVYAGEASADMYRVGSALVTAATIPLALGLTGDTYVVMNEITTSPAVAIAAAVATFILLIGLWHAYPMVTAARRTHRGLGNQSDALV
jgi:xanthine/uracil/vitamin C permease (AzgA family)